MEKIILVKPSIEYKNEIMSYKKVFEENAQNFDGCARIEDLNSYNEWLDFNKRFKNKLYKYVKSYKKLRKFFLCFLHF